MNARQLSTQILLEWFQSGSFAENIIDKHCKQSEVASSDRALVQAIVYAVIRNLSWLEHVIGTMRKGKLDEQTRVLLLVGLAQLLLLNVAAHAAVNETVNLAPAKTRGLVNAILRGAQRNSAQILEERSKLPVWVRYSVPKWIYQVWCSDFGEEQADIIAACLQKTPSIIVRRNKLVPLEEIPAQLRPIEDLSDWYVLEGSLPLEALASGALSVTDTATRHAVEMLPLQAGFKVLDACAAPGGKSVALLNAAAGNIELHASDVDAKRIKILERSLLPYGHEAVKIFVQDWTQAPQKSLEGFYDAILIDAPCSNSGVMQRRVDVRWRLSPQEIARMAALQYSIMQNCALALKSGGYMLYSTCSIDAQENTNLVEKFLKQHADFELVKQNLSLPGTAAQGYSIDGSYAALLRKK